MNRIPRKTKKAFFSNLPKWVRDRRLVPITVTPAQHFSARTPFDRKRLLRWLVQQEEAW